VDQPLHVLRRDAAIAEELLNSGIDGHDTIERTRKGIGVELDEDFTFVGHGKLGVGWTSNSVERRDGIVPVDSPASQCPFTP
jgi:hypothetical protein